jgi:hypothetical protein
MKRALLLGVLGAATALVAAMPAHADTFDFSFGGPVFFGSGTITATSSGPGTYDIDSISGSLSTDDLSQTSDIDALLPTGTFDGNDNVLLYPGFTNFTGNAYFDPFGVSFSLDDGLDVNIGGFFVNYASAGVGPYQTGELVFENVSPAAAPEPSSLALLGTSILGAAGLLRRRFAA